ncbi:putative sinapine esterase [Helianthus annuus]|nr:putative sinapine esterase [Helianthus annuus]KAJ0682289.1 putative sinapine esterase [Helianthus annuus]
MGYRVFPGIGGGLGLLSEYSVCPVGAPRVLGIEFVGHCKQLIGCSLILMGEIGGNDYNHALESGKSIAEVETYVPYVINAIISAVNELIELGARTLVIPGNLPIGCSATYLTMFYGSNKMKYDNSTGCITQLNKFAEYHNELLKTELNQIREDHPEVSIIYADYYNAAMQIFRYPNTYGIMVYSMALSVIHILYIYIIIFYNYLGFTNGALKACCGGGGPFNYNASISCGDPLSTTCAQPETYLNWDGLHLTEAAYKFIFKSLFEGSYATPQFKSLCPTLKLQLMGGLSSSI